jgi:hypothetical protein
MKNYWMFLGIIGLLSSCYYDKEELLYPTKGCENASEISYTNDLVPILKSNCYSCHDTQNAASRGDGMKLDSYQDFKNVSDASEFLLSIKQSVPYVVFMPKNGAKLSECDIKAFEQWIFDGSKDN